MTIIIRIIYNPVLYLQREKYSIPFGVAFVTKTVTSGGGLRR